MRSFNAETDLQIERLIAAQPETIWRCWAEPDLFKQWFTPPGVDIVECEQVLEPGGRSFTAMKLPDGSVMPSEGCFIVADAPRQLIYTDAMTQGFRPAAEPFMTVIVDLLPQAEGTLYRALVMHGTKEARQTHEGYGFHEGWGTTLAQLDSLAAALD